MERITNKQVLLKCNRMQKEGMDASLDGQYGRFSVFNREGGRKLSPRTSNREIWEWLDAYEQGFEAGKKEGVRKLHRLEHEAKSYDLDRD